MLSYKNDDPLDPLGPLGLLAQEAGNQGDQGAHVFIGDPPLWLGGDHAACGRFVEKYLYQCARTVANEAAAVMEIMVPKGREAVAV